MNIKRYSSNAKWPSSICASSCDDNVSVDMHETKEAAEAVCNFLKANGFCGERQIFPIKVWVEEINVVVGDNPLTFENLMSCDISYLEKFSTKRLLDVFRRLSRAISIAYYNMEIDSRYRINIIEMERVYNIMKGILDKREHVLNKRERRRALKKKRK